MSAELNRVISRLQGKKKAALDLDGKTGGWGAVFDCRTYHVALIACMEGTVKNALLYWSPLMIGSLVSHVECLCFEAFRCSQ